MRSRRIGHGKYSGAGVQALAAAMALFSSPAWAQVEKQAEEPAKAETAPDIVVTGTRLANGFQAPTPVTVLTGENLIAVAPTNVASALAQLPSLATSQLTTTTDPGSQAGGTNGSSLLNLRNLGVTRNLVLLNGRRVVSTNAANSVDIATLPQNLIQRVDIVTGGASAAYGSDAVAGVVNFVLDTKFTGLKGDIGGGISTYGDLGNFKGSLAWGRAFLDNRLHIIASAQYAKEYGVAVNESSGRDWFDDPVGLIPNTLSSSPSNLIVPSIRSSVGSDGGLITNTILRGTQFLVGGVPAPFNRGFNPGAGFQSGGDGSQVHYNFAPDQRRNSEFVHAEYDVSDDVSLFAEGRFAYNFVNSKNQIAFETGSGNQFTIYSGNPFIPASIQTIMAANNIPSFTMGRYLNDYPIVNFTTKTLTDQETIGFKGKNLFGGRWAWNASFARGHTFQDQIQHNLPLAPNIYAAADAVVNPQTGQIVCRSQFYNAAGVFVPGGTGLSSGCKPINFFGNGSVDPSAIGYTIGDSSKEFHLTTYVAQASVSGDLGSTFQLGAGPISIAAGVEYREESAYQTTDALSPTRIDATGIRGVPAALNNKLGPYRFFNPLPFSGSFNVKEAFVELGVPILKDKSFARSLAFDVAARHTDYSQTGGVTTWKVGADWQVIDDIRLRGSVSRDIRAPNILELFNAATQFTTTSIYPSSAGGVTTPTLNVIAGNPDLQPEKALTQAYGVVLTPTFAPGLSFSADYYNIKIKGAIASLTIQQTLDNCAAGQTIYCSQINFANGVATVATPGLNLNVLATSGIDFEAGYRTNLFGNPLSLRVLATRLLSNYTTPPNSTKISTLGGDVAPHWRVTAQLAYDTETWKVFVQQRYIGPALMDATKVEGVYTDENDIPAVFYTDATLSYKLKKLGLDAELYLTVNNIFNREPPIDIAPPSSFSIPNARNNYDRIGRMYNAGLRFNF